MKETNLVLRLGASEVIHLFISLLQRTGHMPAEPGCWWGAPSKGPACSKVQQWDAPSDTPNFPTMSTEWSVLEANALTLGRAETTLRDPNSRTTTLEPDYVDVIIPWVSGLVVRGGQEGQGGPEFSTGHSLRAGLQHVCGLSVVRVLQQPQDEDVGERLTLVLQLLHPQQAPGCRVEHLEFVPAGRGTGGRCGSWAGPAQPSVWEGTLGSPPPPGPSPWDLTADDQQVVEEEKVNLLEELLGAQRPRRLGARHLLQLPLLQQPARVRNDGHRLRASGGCGLCRRRPPLPSLGMAQTCVHACQLWVLSHGCAHVQWVQGHMYSVCRHVCLLC